MSVIGRERKGKVKNVTVRERNWKRRNVNED